jgi:beta-lactamase regulating signal transducer with metallopeptidase domain
MNVLGSALWRSAISVTVVTLFALVLERWASRRGPRAGSWVASASLLLIVVVTLAAFCPLPRWLIWQSLPGIRALDPPAASDLGTISSQADPQDEQASRRLTTGYDSREGRTPWPALLDGLRRGLTWGSDTVRSRPAPGARAWLVVWIAGASVSLLRLLIGLWGVHDCRRRSTPVTDPCVLGLLEDLRKSAGRRQRIELREFPSNRAATAAAVGWLRPAVLLPADWRTWNELELRAVLAHEIAHVARADYVAGLMARLGLALHFYHPLVHWISARLQLQQELAADAEAAQLAGGRQGYLLALARLALRTETSRLAWPAREFLSAQGQLIRRIHVLKQKAPTKNGPLPVVGRIFTIVSLLAVGLGAIALRGQSPAHAPLPPAAKNAEPPASKVERTSLPQFEPFGVDYLPPNPAAIFAVRPAAIFGLPGMQVRAKMLNDELRMTFGQTLPEVESIDQACVELSVVPRDKSKKQPGRIMTGDFVVRAVREVDWKPALKQFAKSFGPKDVELREVQFRGKTYYKTSEQNALGANGFLYLPDTRTVVYTSREEHLRGFIERGASHRPEFLAGDDWRNVDRGLFAVALDTRQAKWKLDVASDDPADLPIAPLLLQARRWTFGVNHADRLMFRAIGTCGNTQDAEAVTKVAQSVLAMLGHAYSADANEPDELKSFWRVAQDLVRECRVHQTGDVVELTAERKVATEELAAFLALLVSF